jgi:hypothetical protein
VYLRGGLYWEVYLRGEWIFTGVYLRGCRLYSSTYLRGYLYDRSSKFGWSVSELVGEYSGEELVKSAFGYPRMSKYRLGKGVNPEVIITYIPSMP